MGVIPGPARRLRAAAAALLLAVWLPGCGLLLPPPLGNLTFEKRPVGYVAGNVGLIGGAAAGAVLGGVGASLFGGPKSGTHLTGAVIAGGLAGAVAGSLAVLPIRFFEELLYWLFGWDEGGHLE